MKAVPNTACFVACLLVALVLRLAVILHEPGQLAVDRDAYLGIAQSVADGRGYSSPNSTTPTAFRPPLYPLTLAMGFWLVPQLPVVAELNLLAGLMTVWVTASLGRHLHLGRGRYLAALLVAADPLLLQYTARPMTESLCTFLAALWLWSMIGGLPNRLHKSAPAIHLLLLGIFVGITFGLLVLCRPTFWPIASFYILWWSIRRSRFGLNPGEAERFGGIVTAAGSVIGTGMIVLPWLARNWLVFGVPILTTTHGGYTLLLGNNPVFYEEVIRKPWGTVWDGESLSQWDSDRRSQVVRDLGPDYNEVQEDAWNSRQAKSFIMSHPGSTAEATLHRIRSLWNIGPQGEAVSGVDPAIVTATTLYYFVVLTFSFLGMILVLRTGNRAHWLPLYVLILSIQFVHLLYWTNTRMRAPLTPALSLFAAAVVSTRTRAVSNGEAGIQRP